MRGRLAVLVACLAAVALCLGLLLDRERAAPPSADGAERDEAAVAPAVRTPAATGALLEGDPRPAGAKPASSAATPPPARRWTSPRVVVALTLDGRPGLPHSSVAHVNERMVSAFETDEDLERGEMALAVTADELRSPRVRVQAKGYLPAEGVPTEVDEHGNPHLALALVSGGRIDVDATFPDDREMRFELERRSGDEWVTPYERGDPPRWREVTNDDELPLFVGLEAGRYRVVERLSGSATGDIWVGPGRTEIARFRLSDVVLVRGRVLGPPGSRLEGTRVTLAHVDDATETSSGEAGADGVFALRARQGRRVRITAEHPYLRAVGRETVEVVVGQDEPVLRFEEGPEIRFRPDTHAVTGSRVVVLPAQRSTRSSYVWTPLSVTLIPDGAPGRAVHRTPAREDDVRVGVPSPGRWRMVLDGLGGTPVERTVEVGDGAVDLGTIAVPRGSRVRCQGLAPERLQREGLVVRGRAHLPVPHQRWSGATRPDEAVLVGGFAAGEVRVALVRTSTNDVVEERTVVVDGVHDVDVTFGR
jgi:hypothetical protein